MLRPIIRPLRGRVIPVKLGVYRAVFKHIRVSLKTLNLFLGYEHQSLPLIGD